MTSSKVTDNQGARPRGRPRKELGPAVTREAIIEEALHAVIERGTAGLNLRQISRALGVGLSSIQRHFPTKDDLWRAAVDEVLNRTSEPPRLVESPDAHATMSDILRNQMIRAAHVPGLTSATWNDQEEGSEERLDYLIKRSKPLFDEIAARITTSQELGLLRSFDVPIFLALVSIGVNSVASSRAAMLGLYGLDLADEATVERFATSLADVLLYGIIQP
jgi:AcrR family transcriptional regulator